MTQPPPLPNTTFRARISSFDTFGASALAGWIALVLIARFWGLRVVKQSHHDLYVGAVPFFGEWDWVITHRQFFPIVVGLVGIVALPKLFRTIPWKAMLGVTALIIVLWSLCLAYTDKPAVAWDSIQHDYGQHTERIDQQGLHNFLDHYVENQKTFPTHLQAHPPGMVVSLWTASKLHLEGKRFQVAFALAGCAIAGIAALVALRRVANENKARVAAPFVALAPSAVWHTNGDSVFAGLSVLAVALVVFALTEQRATRARLYALAGGVAFGVALLFSYGVALLVLPMIAIAIWRKQIVTLMIAGASTVVTLAAPLLVGFNWILGLQATKTQYDLNLATVRPYWYFLIANLAVFAVAIGPASVVGLSRLGRNGAGYLIAAGFASMLLADLTGLSNAETERIWQPFMPLVLLCGYQLVRNNRDDEASRMWLAVQVLVALVLQAALRTPW